MVDSYIAIMGDLHTHWITGSVRAHGCGTGRQVIGILARTSIIIMLVK